MKNKIYITEENKEKIQELCESVNGKCKTHLASYNLVCEAKIEAHKFFSELLKKHAKFLLFKYCNNQQKANAYKYKYQATELIIGYDSKGYYIDSIARTDFYPNQNTQYGLFWIKEEFRKNNEIEVKEHLYKQLFRNI